VAEAIKIVTEKIAIPGILSLEGYAKSGGYQAIDRALAFKSSDLVEMVKKSGLRGRGGAGFSAGMKWGFIPKDIHPRYLLCNADEGEPGTFKDRYLLERIPHLLLEGIMIASYAIEAHKAYIYIRGEYYKGYQILNKALDEIYEAGYLGEKLRGKDFALDIVIYRGAGAYICGEETGLITSLEGGRGYPKLKPPFPAVSGYLGKPSIVNNVETLSALPWIVMNGPEKYAAIGTEKSTGTRLFSVSGPVKKPGTYEVPLGYPLRDLIEKECGGMKEGVKLKAVIPGGSSSPVLTAEEAMNIKMDFESLAAAKSMAGSGGVIVVGEDTCMADLFVVLTEFYHHESCGQCTPCREGTGWAAKLARGIAEGKGRLEDLDLIENLAKNIMGKTICAFADGAMMPVESYVKKFRGDFLSHLERGKCP